MRPRYLLAFPAAERVALARDLRKLIDRLPDTDRGRVVARALVEAGILTRFQAELLLIGRTHGFFLGQYKILDQLGQGGMGRVYKAVHMTMKRTVAIKVLAPQLVQTAKAMKMFKHEVRAAAQLHHPNIITAFDANQVNGRHYLVMEYVDGPNLDQLVRQRTQLSVGLACEVIRQAALGLQYAHELGLVHRDIKPANLLLQKPSRPNAIRWSRSSISAWPACTASPPIRRATIRKTPSSARPIFCPRAIANLAVVDMRSDIYSLGCTFYFLLTGRVPFPGGPTLEKLMRHANEDPLTVALFRSDVPAEVLAVLDKMMAKKPEDRFQTPQEVAEALTPFAKLTAADLDFTVAATPVVAPPCRAAATWRSNCHRRLPRAGPRPLSLPTMRPRPCRRTCPSLSPMRAINKPVRVSSSMWLLVVLTAIIAGVAAAAALFLLSTFE